MLSFFTIHCYKVLPFQIIWNAYAKESKQGMRCLKFRGNKNKQICRERVVEGSSNIVHGIVNILNSHFPCQSYNFFNKIVIYGNWKYRLNIELAFFRFQISAFINQVIMLITINHERFLMSFYLYILIYSANI